jgi:hypothetical protein
MRILQAFETPAATDGGDLGPLIALIIPEDPPTPQTLTALERIERTSSSL